MSGFKAAYSVNPPESRRERQFDPAVVDALGQGSPQSEIASVVWRP